MLLQTFPTQILEIVTEFIPLEDLSKYEKLQNLHLNFKLNSESDSNLLVMLHSTANLKFENNKNRFDRIFSSNLFNLNKIINKNG